MLHPTKGPLLQVTPLACTTLGKCLAPHGPKHRLCLLGPTQPQSAGWAGPCESSRGMGSRLVLFAYTPHRGTTEKSQAAGALLVLCPTRW